MASESLVKLVVATAEVMGAELSLEGARLICEDLSQYPEPQVADALKRCRRELRGRFTLAEIVARIDDGRPGPEEAWGMYPKGEGETAVVTAEMHLAMRHAWPLVQEGDLVAGRMAFREAYLRIVADARDRGEPVRWEPTLGHDKAGREAPLLEAVERGRLPPAHVVGLLAHIPDIEQRVMLAASKSPAAQIEAPATADQQQAVRGAIEKTTAALTRMTKQEEAI